MLNVRLFFLSVNRKRDAAHIKVKQIFYEAIAKRRASGGEHDDLLQSLLDATYK